jgi:hypothetical protein
MKKVSAIPIMTINTVIARRVEEKSPCPTRKNKIKPVIAAAVKLIATECFRRFVSEFDLLLLLLFN